MVTFQPGALVKARRREWVVVSADAGLYLLRPVDTSQVFADAVVVFAFDDD